MENTIEIQKEFESLISELQRLKSINEITDSNANSAKIVINEIDKFINSIEQFRVVTENDLSLKSKSIDNLLINLNDATSSIVNKIDGEIKNLSVNQNDLYLKSNSIINENKELLNKEINNLIEAFSKLNNSLSLEIGNSSTNILEKFLSEKEVINNHFSNLISLIEKEKRDNETNIENRYNSLIESINLNFGNIESNLTNKLNSIHSLCDNNQKQIKRYGIIIIFSTLIMLGLTVLKILQI